MDTVATDQNIQEDTTEEGKNDNIEPILDH